MTKPLQQEFSLSKHAQDRMRERFPLMVKDIEFEQSATVRARKMYELFLNSTIENRVIHDTMFMQYIQEKYGFDRAIKFFVNQDMLFIGVISTSGSCIVTVVNRNDYASKYLRASSQKMKKKPNTYSIKPYKVGTLHDRGQRSFLIKKKPHREYLETYFDE